jgi:hypothetical protein
VVTPDAGPAAILAGIRERAAHADRVLTFKVPGNFGEAAARSQADVPVLLAAIQRLSELADEWDADAAELDCDIARARKSPHASDHAQARTDEALAGELRGCGAKLREAITAALTGKEGTEDE